MQKMLKMEKWLEILENSPQYLFLASGVNNGEGFWIVGIKNCDEIILEDENLLDCHRKELIGNESAKDILLAIKLNMNNLLNELKLMFLDPTDLIINNINRYLCSNKTIKFIFS